jgi:trehalose-phosphatase
MAVYDVEVLRGGGVSDGYIEARPKGVSKGLFVNHAIATMKASHNDPDFILAIGDDNSDEPMFQYLNTITGSGSAPAATAPSPGTGNGSGSGTGTGSGLAAEEVVTFTVTVGKKPSSAHTFVDDPAAVMDVLSTLIKSAQRDRRHSSAADLLASISNTSQVKYMICYDMTYFSRFI